MEQQLPTTGNFKKAVHEIIEGGKGVLFRGDRNAVLRHDMDVKIKKWRGLGATAVLPPHGWIRAVRESLGMTTHQLAKRLDTCPSAVTRLEQSEATGSIILGNLQRVAEALGCTVVYAIVPETGSLENTLLRRREELAQKMYRREHGCKRFSAAETVVISCMCGDRVHASKVWEEEQD